MLTPSEISSAINLAFANGHALAIISSVSEKHHAPNKLLVEEKIGIVGGSLAQGIELDQLALAQAQPFIADDRQEIISHDIGDVRLLFEIARPQPELIICGCGHVGQAVAQCGAFLGFRVTVIDDREDFAAREKFPDQRINIICDDFVAALQTFKLTAASHVVIVTRGHRHDEICLKEVIEKPVKYLGMIGSRRRTTTIRTHLKREGISQESMKRLHAPIGLDIGAQTPEEIAVAIMAEIIMTRRGGDGRAKSSFVRAN
jgi:xanthine/CO dehydrogenase XdhC/CoxF family maturation factor